VASRIRFGTSSWTEKAWAGTFYPAGLPATEWLSHYSLRFGSVECDATYYAVPSARTVAGWDARTPPGFTLSAKFPRTVVHGGEAAQPDGSKVLAWDEVGSEAFRFLDVMRALGPKCGPLVLQFPYFNKRAFKNREPFLARLEGFLDRMPKEFRYGVELRNKDWIDGTLLDLLRARSVALVLVDLSYMPHPADLAESLDVLTADFAYCRLIGDRHLVDARTDQLDHVVIDQGERLDRWAVLLRSVRERVPETYVYANNHYAGFAPATVEDLEARLGAQL
jgi:uncharacterized protein YecE (DUF72 family)